MKSGTNNQLVIKVYHGYGHAQNLIVMGHVFKNKAPVSETYPKGVFRNALRLLRLFFVTPAESVRLRLRWHNEPCYTHSQDDGFFKFEWQAPEGINAGWHEITIDGVDEQDNVLCSGKGQVFVPHITQYACISDIDDTVLISYSSTILHRLRVLFTRNPHTRAAFRDVIVHYRLLALAHATADVPNPFFYVSSSEWNLYDDLEEFFDYNGLPKGVFLLNGIKRWYQMLKTGKTKHEGKLLRAVRILEAFPNQQFILLGDNSQHDPSIYAAVIEKYGNRIFAVYIRSVNAENEPATQKILAAMQERKVHACMYTNSEEAIAHSLRIGLIQSDSLPQPGR